MCKSLGMSGKGNKKTFGNEGFERVTKGARTLDPQNHNLML